MRELAKVHGSEASAKRLKKRRAAETRLKMYGIAALSLAALALVGLLWSVVGKAGGALTESYISLSVNLDQREIDPDGSGDPSVIGKADFQGLAKDVLKEAFPYVTARGDKRDLYDLLSVGASFELREKVIADPSLIGQTIDFEFLASDIADLYLKGSYGELRPQTHTGALTVTKDGKNVQVTSTSQDFVGVLERVGEILVTEAATARRQAARQDAGVTHFQDAATSAETAEDRDAALAEVASRTAERDRLNALADDLEARAVSTKGAEELDKKSPSVLIKGNGYWIKLTEVRADGGEGTLIGTFEGTEELAATEWKLMLHDLPEISRKVSDLQAVLISDLEEAGKVKTVFNWRFFSSGDSRDPELAGIWGAAVGSFWTMIVTISLAFPIGVMAAIYLEEFAPKNFLTDFIEVNINNLAAVPSIVFGLLGLSVFLGFFGVPRSAPLAGGIVLAVMTLPTIIIAARASIAAVPPSIRDAALGLGASKLQTAFHHVLPLSMPGILTGTIIGMARALGETAPLIMIGMVAFIVDIPKGLTSSASVLPVQIYRWSDFPERAFEARTAAAICVLVVFLIFMNGIAVFLRKRFERRW
ncbi:MAG TPA: phosphate ABC transporter permease PstA [Paracoccaceae bacterium]|nr:phosphate ABC transporter permease PstA [Paracoccaceae bacterium]